MPAVALLGPRQVGKTTLAHAIAEGRKSVYLDLESPLDREKLSDATFYLSGHEDDLVVLDEVQRVPELFATLRGLIDQAGGAGKSPGVFCCSVPHRPICCSNPRRWPGGSPISSYRPSMCWKSAPSCTANSGCAAGCRKASWPMTKRAV